MAWPPHPDAAAGAVDLSDDLLVLLASIDQTCDDATLIDGLLRNPRLYDPDQALKQLRSGVERVRIAHDRWRENSELEKVMQLRVDLGTLQRRVEDFCKKWRVLDLEDGLKAQVEELFSRSQAFAAQRESAPG